MATKLHRMARKPRFHTALAIRPSNAFSKKVENHAYAFALNFMHYNFVKMHQTLRATPAMAAGLIDRPWDISHLIAIIDAQEAVPQQRGAYKKRQPEISN